MTEITNMDMPGMSGVTVVEIDPSDVKGSLSALFGTPVPTNPDGTKNYAALPHMDLDAVPEGGTPEGWAEYLQIIAALPEVLVAEALFPMVQDLVLGHGVDPADAVEAIRDFGKRAHERYPDAKLDAALQAEVDVALADIAKQEAADAAVSAHEAEHGIVQDDD